MEKGLYQVWARMYQDKRKTDFLKDVNSAIGKAPDLCPPSPADGPGMLTQYKLEDLYIFPIFPFVGSNSCGRRFGDVVLGDDAEPPGPPAPCAEFGYTSQGRRRKGGGGRETGWVVAEPGLLGGDGGPRWRSCGAPGRRGSAD